MRAIAIPAILFYQRHLSPRKGFCCAYRHHLGRFSCSTLGLRAIRRYGLFGGIVVLRRRLALCGVTHRRFGTPAAPQRGSAPCDLPCDCSLVPDIHLPDLPCRNAADVLQCCDGSCDGPDRKKKDRRRDAEVYLPPARGRLQRQ